MNNTAKLEAYLSRTLPPEDQLLTEANLILDSNLREDLAWQKNTYTLVQQYGRKQLRAEIEAAHTKLFADKKFQSFREKIFSIFKK